MSYLTSNLLVDLKFWDETTIDFTLSSPYVTDQSGNNNDFILDGNPIYTSIGSTRFSSNTRFSSDLTADHAFYIHRYL